MRMVHLVRKHNTRDLVSNRTFCDFFHICILIIFQNFVSLLTSLQFQVRMDHLVHKHNTRDLASDNTFCDFSHICILIIVQNLSSLLNSMQFQLALSILKSSFCNLTCI